MVTGVLLKELPSVEENSVKICLTPYIRQYELRETFKEAYDLPVCYVCSHLEEPSNLFLNGIPER